MTLPILLIPIYQPSEKTVSFIQTLTQEIYVPVIIVDDGSGAAYQELFRQMENKDITILTYPKNHGKGYALKYGFKYISDHYRYTQAIVTADSDGQHTICDIQEMLARSLQLKNHTILLGSRNFSLQSTPLRSWLGNRITSLFYFLSSGIWLIDTQTGLRAFSYESIADLLMITGDRFEYEMNQLIEFPANGYKVETMPITTVYEEKNQNSHFRTLQDSFLVYRPLISFFISSLSSALVDIFLFFCLVLLFDHSALGLFFATLISRVLSGFYNYHINRKFVFQDHNSMKRSLWKYALLFGCQMLLSWSGVSLLKNLVGSLLLCKLLVDGTLFFISYTLQKRVIFRLT